MFGDSLLVAPVLHETTAKYYLPAGKWTDFWTEKVFEGPKWVVEPDYPLDSIPVFVKSGSVVLLGPEGVDVPDYDYKGCQLEARLYQCHEPVSVAVPGLNGTLEHVTIGVEGDVSEAQGLDVKVRVV